MWLALLGFIRTPLGKWTLAVVGVCGLVVGIYAYGHHAGAQSGAESARAEQVQQDAKQYETLRKAQDDYRRETEALTAKLQAQVEAKDAVLASDRQMMQSLEQQGMRMQAQIQGMTNPQVFADLVSRIAVRAPGDTSTTLSPEELRRMDSIAADYSVIKPELEKAKSSIETLNEKVGLVTQQLQVCQSQVQKDTVYETDIEGLYVRAYNAVPKRRNIIVTILTFGLKGKAKKLDLPKPQDVIAKKLVKAAL